MDCIYDKKVWGKAKIICTPYKNYFSFGKDCGWGSQGLDQHTDLPVSDGLPMFVKDFETDKFDSAALTFTALGCVDIYINGKKIGSDEMKPGWTDYRKRTLYYTYDISEFVKKGKNRILFVVASGWYLGRITGGCYGHSIPGVMACIEIVKGDKAERIVTGKDWLAKVGGQIRTADIWDGEYRDGREDDYTAISKPGYSLEGWNKSKLHQDFTGEISPFVGPTVQVRDGLERRAASVTVFEGTKDNGTKYGEINVVSKYNDFPVKLKKGQNLIIDLEQEIVGHGKITVSGNSGTTVKLRYSEFLNDSGDGERGNDGPKGSVYTINLRSALAKAYYVLNGKGDEEYASTFTFFGFRYIEITADDDVEIKSFRAEVVGSATEETGKIETSDELINKLISNIIWGQRGNYLSVPTDCPQRDERYGWTGDTQAFSMTAAYNADVYGFFRKWLQDMRDSQTKDGGFTDVVPSTSNCSSYDACAWADAGIIVPYNMYRVYGDTTIIKEHYAAMERYLEHLVNINGYSGAEPRYGDWLAYDWCPNEYMSSAYLIHDFDMMAEMSEAIGKERKAKYYRKLREKAQKYYRKHFMTKEGKLKGTTQAEKIIALAFDLVDGEYAVSLADELEAQIKENGNRLSCGFLGTYNLCPALSKYGKDDMAYTLLMQREEPSWLYSIDQGATTIWERWNSYTKKDGFGDVGMNSFNHYAYGAVEEWMYRYMAGIEPLEPGFKKLLLRPRPDFRTGDALPEGQTPMKWIKASLNSAAGLIESSWNNENGFVYNCTVPAGITATLELPKLSDKLEINGVSHEAGEYKVENNKIIIELSEGEYEFKEV